MTEFGEQDDSLSLSINLGQADFVAVLRDMGQRFPDDLAYEVYRECLDEPADPELDENEGLLKRGLLFERLGMIEQSRGDYQTALTSYRAARREMGQVSDRHSLRPAISEAHLLMHELDDPVASVEPYEAALAIYENSILTDEAEMPFDDAHYNYYIDLISHLIGAYAAAGRREDLRVANHKLLSIGAMTPSIFGFDGCSHKSLDDEEDPGLALFDDIKRKLFAGADEGDPVERAAGLRKLEELVGDEDFLADLPDQKDHLLMYIYARYSKLADDPWEGERYLMRALSIAKKNQFVAPEADLYMMLADHQLDRGAAPAEIYKTLKKALLSAEKGLDIGVSVSVSNINAASSRLMTYVVDNQDTVGIEKLRRRLAVRKLEIVSNQPSAFNPSMN